MFTFYYEKKCKKCRKTKSLDKFVKNKSCTDGTEGTCLECARTLQKSNPKYAEQHRESARKWEIAHREQRRQIERNRYAKNSPEITETKKKWRQDNPEKVKEIRKRTYENNKEKSFIRAHKRRTLIGNATAEDIKELKSSYGFCVYCNKKVKLEIDHIKPITLGGTNDVENLVPVCRSCNSSKRNKTLLSWLYWILGK